MFLVGNRLLPGHGIRVRFGRVDRVPQHNKSTHRMSSTYWSLADRVQVSLLELRNFWPVFFSFGVCSGSPVHFYQAVTKPLSRAVEAIHNITTSLNLLPSLTSSISILKQIVYFYAYGYFTCIYVCVVHVYPVPSEVRRYQILRNWSYR